MVQGLLRLKGGEMNTGISKVAELRRDAGCLFLFENPNASNDEIAAFIWRAANDRRHRVSREGFLVHDESGQEIPVDRFITIVRGEVRTVVESLEVFQDCTVDHGRVFELNTGRRLSIGNHSAILCHQASRRIRPSGEEHQVALDLHSDPRWAKGNVSLECQSLIPVYFCTPWSDNLSI